MLFGGEFGTGRETKFLHFGDTWIFDFEKYSWTALPLKTHPPSRSGHRMAVCGKYVVCYGGYFDTGAQSRYMDDLWVFDWEGAAGWRRADWMSEFEGRPSARSGFVFVPHPEGLLLYGGYTQVRTKRGSMEGQVLDDLWLLRMDPADCQSMRWRRMKAGADAPR